MPKNYGVKEKDQVVAHILELLLSGKLRSGDRVNRNEIAAALGLSRVPVQEALVQLEHDGVLATRYHRGAFIQRFDADTLREQHELHGLMTGAASARAAADPRPGVLAALDDTLAILRTCTDPQSYIDTSERYRNIVVETYSGPRLRAAIQAAQTLMPRDFWLDYSDISPLLLPFVESENDAIHDGSPERARQVCLDRANQMATVLIEELNRRGVFGDQGLP